MANQHIKTIRDMARAPVRNYAIPGLTSWIIGGEHSGKVRLFECSREHQEPITPHSHRFAFSCLVLNGHVHNKVWTKVAKGGDEFVESTLFYTGEIGHHTVKRGEAARYTSKVDTYRAGEWYSMEADDVHSIYFSRGASVLFFEGPSVSDRSIILEPFVDGDRVPTFKVEPWMFIK